VKERACDHCGEPFRAQHANHRFCSRACRRRSREPVELGTVAMATERAIAAATHLTAMDLGAVAALRVLAVKLDALAADEASTLDELKAKFDNVTLPTYLKFCESLGLTPAGRTRLADKKPEASGGKLGKLRSIPKPRSA